MPPVSTTGKKPNPFPGLRPFTEGDCHSFFGRTGECREITDKLMKSRFVAITGPSGCGKSSMISCGIIPGIAKLTTPALLWRVINVRPGSDPLGRVTEAFAKEVRDSGTNMNHDEVREVFLREKDPVTELLKIMDSGKGEKTLLVIDQLEDLFRYGKPGTGNNIVPGTPLFFDILTNAVTGGNTNLYVLIALRSEFISECAHFKVFTQILNNSNYLVPGMTNESLREVISGPVAQTGATIDDELVEMILDDIKGQADPLPLLQHAMMRTWDKWTELEDSGKMIGISEYLSAGALRTSLSRHADEEYEKLDQKGKTICEKVFRIITGKGSDNNGFRNPADVKTLCSAIQCNTAELTGVIDRFRSPGISFIRPFIDVQVSDDTIIDLSHECLINHWDRLKRWVEEEAASVQVYLNLSEAAALYQHGKAGLLKPPDLLLALKWRDENKPVLAWAQRYDPAFERVIVYLRTSEKDYLEGEERKQRQNRWRFKRIRIISSILTATLMLALVSLALISVAKVRADKKRNLAVREQQETLAGKIAAEEYATIALRKSITSDSAAIIAEKRGIQERQLREMMESKYLDAREIAEREKALVESAEKSAMLAVKERDEARRLRMISLAKSMSLRSLNVSGQKDLKALLAYQAYLFNKRNSGYYNDGDIYSALYEVAIENGSPLCKTFTGQGGHISSLAFIPGTREFITADSDGKIVRWNLDKKEQSLKIVYSGNEIIDVMAVSPGADWLACGADDAGIRMIPLNGGENSYKLSGHSDTIRSLVFSFDGKSLYSAALDGKVLKWDLSARTSANLAPGRVDITSIDLSADGKYIAGISNEGSALIWDQDNTGDRFTIGSEGRSIKALRFSPGEQKVAVGYDDGYVELWDATLKEKVTGFMAGSGEINGLRFNGKKQQLATSGLSGGIRLWDLDNPEAMPVSLKEEYGNTVILFEFSPDGEVILSVCQGNDVLISGRPAFADTFAADGCSYVTRNFTNEEWLAYVGGDIEYEKTCPGAEMRIRIREIR